MGIRYVLEKEQEKYHVIPLLDSYWEDVLLQNGKSDVEILIIFNQIYEKVVEAVVGNGGII